MKVIFIGEDIYRSRSGVVTVMKQLLNDDFLAESITYKAIYTTGDEFKASMKLQSWLKAYLKFLYHLPTSRIVHVHHASDLNFWLSAVFVYICRVAGKKVILHNHAADFKEFFEASSSLRRKWMMRIFKKAHVNIVLSKSWLEWYSFIAPAAHWKLLPNSIEVPDGVMLKQLPAGDISLVYLARIEERKGFFDLIDIMPALIEKHPQCKLYIAGQGDIAGAEKILKAKNIQGNVVVLGHIDSEQRDALLRKSQIFILPSYNEGLPMSLLEAMSHAMVPVTTPVGGIPDVVSDGFNGILVAPGDKCALLKSISTLLLDHNLYKQMSQKASEIISKNFSFELYKLKILDEYIGLSKAS